MEWLVLLAMAWLGYGLYLVCISRSRGLIADLIFVFSWPYHYVQYWRGLD